MATLAGAAAHGQTPPLQEVMETITQLIMQDTSQTRGVDRAGDVSSSTSHLTGASLSRIKTCATVAKAVPKPSTVLKALCRGFG